MSNSFVNNKPDNLHLVLITRHDPPLFMARWRAQGRMTDGSVHHSDIVISAADGRTTIFGMLEGKYINRKIRGYYDGLPVTPSVVYVGLGVARSFKTLPQIVTGIDDPLAEPVTIGGQERKRMTIQLYNLDPNLAPAGKTVVKVVFTSDYEYWKKLKQCPERHKAEKEQIADRVEMWDVATPMTFERYTGNWQGNGLEPGGSVPTATMSGRDVIQIICKQAKRPFVTTTP